MVLGGVQHGKKHDIGDAKNHTGDIYDALVGALHALTAANVAVDTQTLHDAISAAIVGMDWQQTIIRFEAMVTNEPVVPSDGDRYISTEAGTIPSTTQAVLVDDVCQWDTATSLWIITSPDDGWAVQETQPDPNIAWWYSGSAWRKIGTMVDHSNLLNLNWSVCAHVLDKYVKFLYSSDTQGDDTLGDGTALYPYKTTQKAINVGTAGGLDNPVIIPDNTISLENITIPASKTVTIMGLAAAYDTGNPSFDTITISDGCKLFMNNIRVNNRITESGVTSAIVRLEDCLLNNVVSVANTDFYLYGTILGASAVTNLAGANAVYGYSVLTDGELFIWGNTINGINMNLKQIENMALCTASDQGARKGYVDGEITTHTKDISCSVFNTGAQAVGNNTWTAISFAYEEFDTDSMHESVTNPTRITIPSGEGGKYLILALGEFQGSALGVRAIKAKKNGATDVLESGLLNPTGVNATPVSALRVIELAAGDYIEMLMYQTSGGALNALAPKCNLQVVKQRG